MVDVEALFFVRGDELVPIAEGMGVVMWGAVKGFAGRGDETDRAVVECQDYEVSLVHLAVMETTESYEVGELCLAAVGPVLNVMTIEIARVGAAGEATAAAVARLHCAV